MPLNLAVLASGRGSNLEAILRSVKDGRLDAKVHVVISNNPDAFALAVARKYGVHALAIDHRGLRREEHEQLLLEELELYPLDFLVLAGYMRVLTPSFLKRFSDQRGFYRVINIHPSLLPDFPGTRGYDDAFAAGVPFSGVTVHLVDEDVDHGPVLAQARFERLPGDSLADFRARGLSIEHQLYPQVLGRIADSGIEALLPACGNPARAEVCLAVVPADGRLSAASFCQLPLYWLTSTRAALEGADWASVLSCLREILTDPLHEDIWIARGQEREAWAQAWAGSGFRFFCERQFLPGVTDNLARTVEEALRLAFGPVDIRAASGAGFLFGRDASLKDASQIERYLRFRHYHPLTEKLVVHDLSGAGRQPFLTFPAVNLPATRAAVEVNLDLGDDELARLSRERILALSLDEMRAIREHFGQESVRSLRASKGLPAGPTDVELEIIAQTWSEHCKHKIFNAVIRHVERSPDGAESETVIDSLYRTFIQSATTSLSASRPDLLSVFKDNAGVVKWDDDSAVCFKVETHNSPSALEPYGGALTGILGVNRDILGTGLGAHPIANTDVFCFAYPEDGLPERPGMLPPAAIIQGVRRGVQDGGNKSGIPTVNGAVFFDRGYRAKPLVFCGTVGLMPLSAGGMCAYVKHTRCGDTVVMAGGRVGVDGIHGATFSSEALHEGSPVSAVQIGDPFTQKRLADFIMEARDLGLISGITDNGAGGLSSSVGEMAELTGGALLRLEDVPLKYAGLADYEIVISESQERMTLSTQRFPELAELAARHNVEVTAVGMFDDSGYFRVERQGRLVAMLDLGFLHGGAPRLHLQSVWSPPALPEEPGEEPPDMGAVLSALMASPNICSRESVIRQYDHEVQGTSVVKPLMGPRQLSPCDAAVIRPKLDSPSGLVVSNGLAPRLSSIDTYCMAVFAVDEAVRNAVAVGADPESLAILDNFCWPDPVVSPRNLDAAYKLAQLVRACRGLHDAAIAYGLPLISGKDSMKNDYDDGVLRISIPPTLLVSAIGRMADSEEAVTSEFKAGGDSIYLLQAGEPGLAGSEYAQLRGLSASSLPAFDPRLAAAMYRRLHEAILKGLIESCHDVSDGGLCACLAESAIGSGLGVRVDARALAGGPAGGRSPGFGPDGRLDVALFGEGPGRLVVSVAPQSKPSFAQMFAGMPVVEIGEVADSGRLDVLDGARTVISLTIDSLAEAWQARLPFDQEVELAC